MLFVGPRAADFLALWRQTPVASAVVAEGGPGSERFARTATRFVSLEDRVARRHVWTSASMDRLLSGVVDTLSGLALDQTRPTVVPYAVTDRLERCLLAFFPEARLIGPRAAERRWLDDKRNVRAALSRLGVPVIHSMDLDLTRASYADLKQQVGPDFVVQARRGSSGFDTYFVNSAKSLDRVPRRRHRRYLVAPYAGTCVLNTHLGITDHETLVTPPSVQLAGLPALGIPAPIYSGNDFGAVAGLPLAVLAEARAVAVRVAGWLARRGYRGIAGVDMIIDDGVCRVLEVNPRLQGSTWLLGEAEIRVGAQPTLTRVVLESPEVRSVTPPLHAAHLLIRQPSKGRTTMSEVLSQPGVYTWRSGTLVFDRPAMGLADCADDEIFVDGTANLPQDRVDPLAVIGRLSSWRPLVKADGSGPTELAEAILTQALWRGE